MFVLITQNTSQSLIHSFVDYLAIASCILVYLSYTIITNSNYCDDQNHDIRLIHSHLDVGLLNVEVRDFLEPRTLIVKNIQEDEEILKSESFMKIFFVESHTDEVRTLDNPRFACSIESAAIINPSSRVYLIFLSNSTRVVLKYSELSKILLSYDNIHIRFLNIYEFSKGTILEDLFASDAILKSKYPVEHMADVMRALILSKYSGIYLDLDVLSLVPLASIKFENFACPESINRITNAVIRVNQRGQKVMNEYKKKLSTSYNAVGYSDNGPKLFSESIKTFCTGTDLITNNYTICDEFTILPTRKCYPVNYSGYKKFYVPDDSNYVFKRINDSESYFVHIWNKMNHLQDQHDKLTFNSSAAYVDLARNLCSNVLRTTEKYF